MGSLKAGQKVRASQLNITCTRYYSTDSTSTIATGATELILPWAVAANTSPNVTVSGTNNTTFTLNKTGYWIVEFQTRYIFSTNPSSGDTFAYSYLVSGVVQISGMTVAAPIPLAALPNRGTVRAFNAGDQVQVRLRNSTNQILSCANSFTTWGEMSHISLTWLQGL